jgi:undecaprenyl-diphosphatase
VSHLTYLQAIVIGLLQGVTELFPISSLGHSVLVPALIGGKWETLVTQESASESPYLAFIVGLHVATATALVVYYWRDWVRLIKALFGSIRSREIRTSDQKMIWLLIIATIPAGLTGIALEHTLRTVFAKPIAAAAFLTLNGLILFAAERMRRSRAAAQPDTGEVDSVHADAEIASALSWRDAIVIGIFQIAALFAGISRSGITMAAGLFRNLNHENAMRFAFLLATPIILAAGLYKIPDLLGPLGNGIRGQVVAGSVAAFIAALFSVSFLSRYFRTRTLTPFAVYSVCVGVGCLIYFH